MDTIVDSFVDRRKYSAPFIGYCPMREHPFTVFAWELHPLRQRFALVECPFCSEDTGVLEYHAIELLEVRG